MNCTLTEEEKMAARLEAILGDIPSWDDYETSEELDIAISKYEAELAGLR